ncbi:aminotransferase class I/II-fold pyridoxal phosphate-dependent enzyme [Aliiroseovarius sp. S1339]|uniref:aminotransferase class I/II-fold pyridoxal phosphate-dependent enzyme n=1 Tax=Aliiroseovarius sp. S1339 TaxID=2936990 RepID=UPI0020BD6E9B|nr:aminotransferase class I/II-fold pyridoxal phosphate-dependent enzyme [Aliiroseovarius sp. S1339]MCK8463167.1 aminotransferase class I/II-fold pyridoxal phosphate-dependent enzyme [Aliiroseovarius sp. S1339]
MTSQDPLHAKLFARRMANIKPSASMAAAGEVSKLRREGVSIHSLAIGEPDFAPPDAAVSAMLDAVKRNDTGYLIENRRLMLAIAERFEKNNGLKFAENEIALGAGLKQIIFAAFCATIDEGDEVVVPAPYWVSYPDIAQLFGAKIVEVQCAADAGFKLTPEQLKSALTPKTKWVVLNSPNNPTGAVYSHDEMAALGAVISQHPSCLVLSDEIYEHFVYDGANFSTFLGANQNLRERILTANGISKAYALTGLRIGFAGGSKDLIAQIKTIISQDTSCTSSISQAAALAALSGDQSDIPLNRAAYQLRRDRLLQRLNNIPGMVCREPEGAFYAFVGVAGLLGATTEDGETLSDDSDVARYFVRAAHVATIAGAAYGMSPYLRMSFATSEIVIDEACEQIAKAVSRLKLPSNQGRTDK